MKQILIAFLLSTLSTLSLAASFNVGEMDMKNPKIFSSSIVTGGQPSIEDLKKLKSQGVDTVINLRGLNEFDQFNEEEEAEKVGLKYIALPVNGAAGVTLEATERFNQVLKSGNGNLYIHCASGNRVGALMALKARFHDNKSKEEALEIGARSGLTRLKGKVERIFESKE